MSDNPGSPGLERYREYVIDKLSEGYSADRIGEEEFERRVEIATSAQSEAVLQSLIADMHVAGSAPPPAASAPRAAERSVFADYQVNYGEAPKEASVIAIFSGSDRKGVWEPPKVLNAITIFGGADIDLREAPIPADGMTINAVAIFGGVDIIVPEGVNVRLGGAGIFGAFEGKRLKQGNPDAPTIKIDGIALFGGVDVKTK